MLIFSICGNKTKMTKAKNIHALHDMLPHHELHIYIGIILISPLSLEKVS